MEESPESGASPRSPWSNVGLVVGPLAAAAVAFLPPGLQESAGQPSRAGWAAGVATLMALWWLTEAVPLTLTACLPLVLFPLFGVFGEGVFGDVVRTVEPFGDAYVILFLGGMTIGAAMEQTGLHRRVALHIMRRVGGAPHRLLLGVLVATAAVSLWISNTATAVMMLPVAIALTKELEKAQGRPLREFGCSLMLGVAYAANVGGIGTKIGTGANSIFTGYLSQNRGIEIGFGQFMAVGFPFVVLFLPLVWAALWRYARRDHVTGTSGKEVLERELLGLGRPRGGEIIVGTVFLTAALLWIFGDVLRPLVAPVVRDAFGGFRLLGKHYEASVAVLAALSLLGMRTLPLRGLLRLPFGALFLLGGSFSMAAGIEGSGLSLWLGERLSVVASLSLPAQLFLATFATIALSAVASNVATVNVMMHVLPPDIRVLFAATIGASCDFMLPAGTPPNAIVFGSGYVRLSTMMRVGFALDVAAGVVIATYMLVWGQWWLG